jgi:cell division transport system permease protein
MIGFAAAGLMVLLLAERIEGLGSELIGSVTLAYGAWASLLLLPIAGTALAMVTARMTILNAVGRIL